MLNNQNLWEKHSEQKEQQIKMSQETNGSGMFQVENSTPLEYSENRESTVSDKHTESRLYRVVQKSFYSCLFAI